MTAAVLVRLNRCCESNFVQAFSEEWRQAAEAWGTPTPGDVAQGTFNRALTQLKVRSSSTRLTLD